MIRCSTRNSRNISNKYDLKDDDGFAVYITKRTFIDIDGRTRVVELCEEIDICIDVLTRYNFKKQIKNYVVLIHGQPVDISG
jgi:hypothetical protein